MFSNRIVLIFSGVIAGAICGFVYWKYQGCSGTCLITSSPIRSSLYGALVGGLLFSIFINPKSKQKDIHPPRDETKTTRDDY